MTGELNWVPPDVDPSVPNPARIYDYWLDGAHNFAADRMLAEKIAKIMPGVREAARFNRGFLRRAALFMVESGIRQFLDIGSGLPTIGNLHETVQSVAPECRVVYVDRDPIAVEHSQLLVADNDRTEVLQADMRDVDGILDSPGVNGLLDLSQPVGLFMLLLLHFVPDSWDPVGVVGRYRDRLASGSYLAVSHVAGDGTLSGLTEAIAAYQDTQNMPYPRGHDEVLRFFTGFELVEPGLVGCPLWRPEAVGGISDDPAINALPYSGVGRKP